MKIDAHQHFWKYSPQEYAWIDDDLAAIRRDFLPPDLQAEITAAGIDGVVSVHARQKIEETETLLHLAARHPFIKGVVGWVPLVNPSLRDDLERFSSDSAFKAVRHVVQDEPDDNFILREDFNRGVHTLLDFNLVYDILVFETHLPQTIRFVDLHPYQIFVLDHIGKPRIKDGSFSSWRENIRKLAERPNVCCKISGMVTEADMQAWTEKQLQPYLEAVLAAFGPERLMFGSDWPVCTAVCSYKRWLEIVSRFVSRLSPSEQERILGGTAIEIYKL